MERITNTQSGKLRRDDILYPELSFKLVGLLFEVSNELGGNMLEKFYQKAIASILKREGINFKEQVEVKLNFGDKVIANGYLDFLIEDK